jgi:hypothetical protein
VPERTVNRTAGAPAQTSVAAFQSGGAEAFVAAGHWSSTESLFRYRAVPALQRWHPEHGATKATGARVRAFRKLAL